MQGLRRIPLKFNIMAGEIGGGSWRIPECWPENRDPVEVPPDARNPFCHPDGTAGAGGCAGTAEPADNSVSCAGTQDPSTGTQVETKATYQTNQVKDPEPSCDGGCDCSPGLVEVVNKKTEQVGNVNVPIKYKLSHVSINCKCTDKDGKELKWYQRCEDTEIDASTEAPLMQQTWDEMYSVDCSCQSENCTCSESYTVTTSYAREFYTVPSAKFKPPNSFPGCECNPNSPDKKDCPEPCKPVTHNYGKCKGCGGYHTPDNGPIGPGGTDGTGGTGGTAQ